MIDALVERCVSDMQRRYPGWDKGRCIATCKKSIIAARAKGGK